MVNQAMLTEVEEAALLDKIESGAVAERALRDLTQGTADYRMQARAIHRAQVAENDLFRYHLPLVEAAVSAHKQKLGHHREDAQQNALEAIARAWKNGSYDRQAGRFGAWAKTIATRVVTSYVDDLTGGNARRRIRAMAAQAATELSREKSRDIRLHDRLVAEKIDVLEEVLVDALCGAWSMLSTDSEGCPTPVDWSSPEDECLAREAAAERVALEARRRGRSVTEHFDDLTRRRGAASAGRTAGAEARARKVRHDARTETAWALVRWTDGGSEDPQADDWRGQKERKGVLRCTACGFETGATTRVRNALTRGCRRCRARAELDPRDSIGHWLLDDNVADDERARRRRIREGIHWAADAIDAGLTGYHYGAFASGYPDIDDPVVDLGTDDYLAGISVTSKDIRLTLLCDAYDCAKLFTRTPIDITRSMTSVLCPDCQLQRARSRSLQLARVLGLRSGERLAKRSHPLALPDELDRCLKGMVPADIYDRGADVPVRPWVGPVLPDGGRTPVDVDALTYRIQPADQHPQAGPFVDDMLGVPSWPVWVCRVCSRDDVGWTASWGEALDRLRITGSVCRRDEHIVKPSVPARPSRTTPGELSATPDLW